MLGPEIQKVLPEGAAQLVNYNYYDIAEGTGIVVFYPLATNTYGRKITQWTSGAYIQSTSALYSDQIVMACQASDLGGWVKIQDIDFDLNFNLPKVIKGNTYVSLSHGINEVTGAAASTSGYVAARIRKWDGVTETELGFASGAVLTNNTVSTKSQTVCLKVTVPKTNFKRGDSLRLTIEGWANNAGGVDADIGFGVDPQDRDDPAATRPGPTIANANTTKCEFHVPFVLDI